MKKLILFLLLLCCAGNVYAECSGAILTASTCGDTDVQAEIDDADPGDTVEIPAGTCNWDDLVSVTEGICLVGAGEGSTLIGTNRAATPSVFSISIPADQRFEMWDIEFHQGPSQSFGLGSSAGVFVWTGAGVGKQLHIHDVSYNDYTQGSGTVIFRINNLFGAFQFITWDGGYVQVMDINHGSMGGVGIGGDASWAAPSNWGSADFLYIEDSTWLNSLGGAFVQNLTDSTDGGGRYVVRYNVITNYWLGHHGTESNGRDRGGRAVEIYHNTIRGDGSDGASMPWAVQFWSGTGIIYKNIVERVDGADFNHGIILKTYRAWDNPNALWGHCDGTGPYDDNEGMVHDSGTHTGSNGATVLTDGSKMWDTDEWFVHGSPYSVRNTTTGEGSEIFSNTSTTITYNTDNEFGAALTFNTGNSYQILRAFSCIDQPGRGESNLVSENPPEPVEYVENALEPIYIWANTWPSFNFASTHVTTDTFRVISNRDYYLQASGEQSSSSSPFNGTVNTGWGDHSVGMSERPSTCTEGVGYADVATDILYACGASNNWSILYPGPYTYPYSFDEEEAVANPGRIMIR